MVVIELLLTKDANLGFLKKLLWKFFDPVSCPLYVMTSNTKPGPRMKWNCVMPGLCPTGPKTLMTNSKILQSINKKGFS